MGCIMLFVALGDSSENTPGSGIIPDGRFHITWNKTFHISLALSVSVRDVLAKKEMCYFCFFCVEIRLCWDFVKDWDDTYKPQSLFDKPVAHKIIHISVILWYWTSYRYLQEWLLVLILTKLEEQVGVQCSHQYQTKVDCSDCKEKKGN